jgi:hypothetical protein
MAKRKRAPARRGHASRKTPLQTETPAIRSPRSRRPTYTPELLAQARHDFEHTERSKESIAFDLGVARSTLTNMAAHEGWRRFVPPPRGLPPAMHLRREVEMLEASVAASPPESILSVAANGAMPAIGDTVERLYRAVREELAAVESLRARLKSEPQGTQDAERTARTLSSLTETLQKLQRLTCAVPNTGSQDDDLPADIDEFRRELARRIEAFVATRTDHADAERPADLPLHVPVRE